MGYHLIVRQSDGSITHRFTETFEDMCEFSDITADAIVYQGEQHWVPVQVGADTKYSNLANDWFRAGIKAQRLFRAQASAASYIAETIPQDIASFKAYQAASPGRVKRGDFLIRRAGVEIEVKCLTVYANDSFYLPWKDLQAHKSMQAMTTSRVVFAIYERHGDAPNPASLCMVDVETILGENNKSVQYDTKSKCLLVPKKLTSPSFTLLTSRSPSGTGLES